MNFKMLQMIQTSTTKKLNFRSVPPCDWAVYLEAHIFYKEFKGFLTAKVPNNRSTIICSDLTSHPANIPVGTRPFCRVKAIILLGPFTGSCGQHSFRSESAGWSCNYTSNFVFNGIKANCV